MYGLQRRAKASAFRGSRYIRLVSEGNKSGYGGIWILIATTFRHVSLPRKQPGVLGKGANIICIKAQYLTESAYDQVLSGSGLMGTLGG